MITWLASSPHCGNTLLRMILLDVFGINSHSKYNEKELKWLFGKQAETWSNGYSYITYRRMREDKNHVWFIKTHEIPIDDSPAIVIIRDGRDACIGLSRFWNLPIRDTMIAQSSWFGTWGGFYTMWDALKRPNTLLVKYEDMRSDPDKEAERIGEFIAKKPERKFNNRLVEGRKQFAQLFRPTIADHNKEMNPDDEALFLRMYGDTMREYGYV